MRSWDTVRRFARGRMLPGGAAGARCPAGAAPSVTRIWHRGHLALAVDRQWRLRALFDHALRLAEADRAAFLEAECADDDALRTRVARRLGEHDHPRAGAAVVPGASVPSSPSFQLPSRR